VGVLLIASPWIFGFANGGIEQWLPVILGVSALLYSLITNYELSMAKILSMKTHLAIDAASGFLLAASPWLFGFADRVSTPHLVLGLLEVGAALMTKTQPETTGFKNMAHR
jgi:hypothetical protein